VFPIEAQNTKLRKEWGFDEVFGKLKRKILKNVWKTPHLLELFKWILSKYLLSILPQRYVTDKILHYSKTRVLQLRILFIYYKCYDVKKLNISGMSRVAKVGERLF
jgi:hypothetical protein